MVHLPGVNGSGAYLPQPLQHYSLVVLRESEGLHPSR